MPEARTLTVEKIIECIESLTKHDWLKIISVGRAWSADLRGWDSEDLLHEALTRLIEEKRHLPNHVNFIYGIQRIMQSLADERRMQQVKYWVDNDDKQPDIEVDEDALHKLVQEESLAALQTRIGNDNTAAAVLNLRVEGHKPEEICNILSIKRTTYDSANKRIRRAVLKNMKE